MKCSRIWSVTLGVLLVLAQPSFAGQPENNALHSTINGIPGRYKQNISVEYLQSYFELNKAPELYKYFDVTAGTNSVTVTLRDTWFNNEIGKVQADIIEDGDTKTIDLSIRTKNPPNLCQPQLDYICKDLKLFLLERK